MISVIVPIYNMEKFILRTVNCLKRQDIQDIEYLMINDGSTDRTLELMTEAISDDSRFRIITITNRGYGHACNLGIDEAAGDYVAIYEPDDVIDSDFYSELAAVARQYPVADIIRYNGIYKTINEHPNRLYAWKEKYTGQILDKYQMKRFWRSHPSIYNGLYRRQFLLSKRIRFCETPGAAFQDAPFIVSLFYSNPLIFIINKTKYYYTIHGGQSINNIHTKVPCIIENWRQEIEWFHANGFKNKNFLIYKMYIQIYSITKQLNDFQLRKHLLLETKKLFSCRMIYSSVATARHLLRYNMFLIWANIINYTRRS